MDGHPLLDEGGGEITIPFEAKAIGVSADGTLSVDGAPAARVGLVDVADQTKLFREAGVLFRADGGTEPVEDGRVVQGFLEQSNVNPVAEMARMIEVQRAYEYGQKLIDQEDERIRQVVQHARPAGLSGEVQESIMRALNIAATGMAAQNMRVEVISHNLANMNTTAYNARRAEFSDLHYQQVQRPGTINSADGTVLPAGVQLGLGVRAAAVSMQVEQGTLTADRRLARPRDRRPGLPRGDAAERRSGLYPRRRAEAQRRRADRHLGRLSRWCRTSPSPRTPRQITINANGEVYAYFDGQTAGAAARPVQPDQLLQREGARGAGLEPLPRDRGLGRGQHRRRRRGRPRHLPPGLSRELERRRGAARSPG